MPSLGITSVQFAKSSPTKQSLVWEIMLRQSISVIFLLIHAHIVKQLLAQKLLRITTWLDITGKTNNESVKLCTLFQHAPFKVTLATKKITWRRSTQMFLCVSFVRSKCQGRTMLRDTWSWFICPRLEVASLGCVKYATSRTRLILVSIPTKDLSMVSINRADGK